MKRFILSLAMLTCITFTMQSYAQENKGNHERKHVVPAELNLSAEQEKKLEDANADFKAKMVELRKKQDLTRDSRRDMMKALREDHRKAVEAILTPEQQTKMKEMQANHREKMRNDKPAHLYKRDSNVHRKKNTGNMRPFYRNNKINDLNLTDDQKQKIDAINKDYRTKVNELSSQRKESLKNILTPEQQSKIKESRSNRDFRSKDRFRGNVDDATKTKLNALKESFEKEKRAVELSRIAPEAQKQKIADLRKKYKDEKRKLILETRNAKKS